MITIVGLGPGSIDDLSLKAWRTIEGATTLYLRTKRHPCVAELPDHLTCHSFDDLYDTLDNFEEVYATIAANVVDIAQKQGDVVYAVPGDPFVGESTVTHVLSLASDAGIPVDIINGISFIEPMLAAIGVDALDGVQIFDAIDISNVYHPPINPTLPALLAQVYSQTVASNVKLCLMNQYPDELPVKLIHAAGNGQSAIIEDIQLYEIDRSDKIDVLTSLYIPPLGKLTSFDAFQNIIAQLRSPEGCPWDRKQTHQSLRPFLVEEAYEVLETIDNDDPDELYQELGDLLLQIVLHTQIAIDDGEFYMSDILRNVNEKMIRRHPHVWGDVDVNGDPSQVTTNWEDIKKAEKAEAGDTRESILDGIPKASPSLFVAHKYQHKAAKVGFDWDNIRGVEEKAKEEFNEILTAESDEHRAEEITDLMFVLVNWLRWLGIDDPESHMRQINAKFYRRFTYVEQQATQNNKAMTDYSLEELDAWWHEAKSKGL
jgi:tetrapyrrole methylase family protein/MazG family protein